MASPRPVPAAHASIPPERHIESVLAHAVVVVEILLALLTHGAHRSDGSNCGTQMDFSYISSLPMSFSLHAWLLEKKSPCEAKDSITFPGYAGIEWRY